MPCLCIFGVESVNITSLSREHVTHALYICCTTMSCICLSLIKFMLCYVMLYNKDSESSYIYIYIYIYLLLYIICLEACLLFFVFAKARFWKLLSCVTCFIMFYSGAFFSVEGRTRHILKLRQVSCERLLITRLLRL